MPKPQRDSQLVKFIYRAALSGEYRNIRRFIHELETAPEFLVLENVELTQSELENRGIERRTSISPRTIGARSEWKLTRPRRPGRPRPWLLVALALAVVLALLSTCHARKVSRAVGSPSSNPRATAGPRTRRERCSPAIWTFASRR